jgi:glutathione S-transferase
MMVARICSNNLIVEEHVMYRLHGFFTQNSMKPLYVLEKLGVEYDYPRVKAWFERLEARDSTARARALVQLDTQAMMSE